MSVETKYSQWVYNLIELTLHKKYRRVIRICDHLESQGITSHELLVIKSYSIAQTRGVKQAIQLLNPFSGPLVNAAKAQYQQNINNFQKAQEHFGVISHQQGDSLMDCLSVNNSFLAKAQGRNIIDYLLHFDGNHYKFMLNKSEAEIVAQINKQTQLFEEAKRERSINLLDAPTFQKRCHEVLRGYRCIEGGREMVKDILGAYIRFLEEVLQRC